MRNEDFISLVDMGGKTTLFWLLGVLEAWLQRPPVRDNTAVSKAGDAFPAGRAVSTREGWQIGIVLDPPEGLTLKSAEELAALDDQLRAAGQPALSPSAVAVTRKSPFLLTLVAGTFVILWFLGWYGAMATRIVDIFTGGVHNKIGSIFLVVFFGGIGLLPMRVLGARLFTGTVLIFEPQRLRVRRLYPLFHRDWSFDSRELVGFAWGHRASLILTTIELIPTRGSPLILLEDTDKSPALRWLARVLHEEMGFDSIITSE